MSKPREFWIAAKYNGNFDAFEMPCDDYSGFHRAARVIEKSAYEILEAKLKIATAALEFYANVDHWVPNNLQTATYGVITYEDIGDGSFQFNEYVDENVGGKKARQALAEIKGGE